MRLVLRADSSFARETLMAWCETHRVDYVFGLARNSRLLEALAIDMAWADRFYLISDFTSPQGSTGSARDCLIMARRFGKH